MNRYVMRKEVFGGLLYDREKVLVYSLDEKRFVDILRQSPPNTDIILRESSLCSTLSAPTRVFFILTNKCNLNCTYCSNDSSPLKEDLLNFYEVSRILYELKNMGVFEISFGGGEPLCHPDFFKIVKLAKELGFVIFINSNGIYTEEQKKMLAKSSIDKIKISIDGVSGVNDSLRGTGNFEKAWSSMLYFKKMGKRVKVNCTLSRKNFFGAFELSKLCNDNECGLKIAPMFNVGRAKNSKMEPILLEEILNLRNQIENYCKEKGIENRTNITSSLFCELSGEKGEFSGMHIECCINRIHTSIDFDGSVIQTGCQTYFERHKPLGNIKNENFSDVWAKIQVHNEKVKNLTKDCRECDLNQRLANYFWVTNDFHGEVFENGKTKIIF
ncbi:MAG: radical SAM protein [Candidatus Diapherotrites archaeon]|nr:radical SAM protein [Candidatus Diapherotrites archaeon]